MYEQVKSNIQLTIVLALVAAGLILLSLLIGSNLQPQTAAAQGPVAVTPSPVILSEETRAIFDQVIGSMQIAAGTSYNLQVTKVANKTSFDSGDSVTFTITITNKDTQAAQWISLQEELPSQLTDVTFQFTGTDAISDNQPNPTWLFLDSIAPNDSVVVKVTGKLVSQSFSETAVNTAKVFAYTNPQEVDVAQASVMVSNPDISVVYFPLIRLDPTPTPTPTPQVVLVYHETFSDDSPDDDDWIEFESNGCRTNIQDGQYRVRVSEDSDSSECLPPARNVNKPDGKPFRTHGEFEVSGYHSEGQSDAALGIFINGEGGDEYYLFRIWPNAPQCGSSGSWEFIRRRNSNNTNLRSETCHSAIKRGYNSSDQNILKIRHDRNRVISVYANGTLLGTFTESASNELTGIATGVYTRRDNKTILVKFDNFKVYQIP